jgi:HTH-type transcriptional regulator, sugar sensing transcriptional regulator
MMNYETFKNLGFSQYEITCYLTLAAQHPLNGSQLSRISGIARSRVYDVLRNLLHKGYVLDAGKGQYVPLPPEELYRRLQREFDANLETLKKQLEGTDQESAYEYIWMIRGYNQVMAKAREMIAQAEKEIYVRLFPESAQELREDLEAAQARGVGIRFISMGPVQTNFNIQIMHPNSKDLIQTIGGRSFDIISDKSEALVGIFEKDQENHSPINWTRNRWFVIANRDSLRHDFYHYLLEKVYERGESLNKHEQDLYAFIKADD